jgi:hypothetical protein
MTSPEPGRVSIAEIADLLARITDQATPPPPDSTKDTR